MTHEQYRVRGRRLRGGGRPHARSEAPHEHRGEACTHGPIVSLGRRQDEYHHRRRGVYFFIPIFVLLVVVLLLGTVVVLGRVRNGRYLRAIVTRVPFLQSLFSRMSIAALERSNPELASAMKKMQTLGTPTTPEQAQRAPPPHARGAEGLSRGRRRHDRDDRDDEPPAAAAP